MREIYEKYVNLLDVKFRSNTLVIIIISLFIIVTWTFLPKKADLAYQNCLSNSQISYYTK